MATVSQAVRRISKATDWSPVDLKHRARLLIEDGLLPKGKGGPGGAPHITTRDFVTLILSMAVPIAKQSPDHIQRFRDLETEDDDGKILRLEDALINRIELWSDKARVKASKINVIKLLLVFDKKYPEAEIVWRYKNDKPKVLRLLSFARKGHEREPLRTDLAKCNKAVQFGPAIFWILWDIFIEEKPARKKKVRRRKGRAK